MPSHTKGKPMPGFLGGSDLAVPGQSNLEAQARAGSPTSRARRTRRRSQAIGNIPNATNLLNGTVNDRARKASWFVPTAKHWVDVENGNILRNDARADPDGQALGEGRRRRSASANIAYTLNQS